MLGKIVEIVNNKVVVALEIDITNQPSIVGLHLVFEDHDRKILGEVEGVNKTQLTANILGEFSHQSFVPGAVRKPSFKSGVRIINIEELELLLGSQNFTDDTVYIGNSNVYDNYHINVDINSFFSSHFSILGNSGSGKSYTVAGFFQRLFINSKIPPVGANFFLFDAYGEYTNAFSNFNERNPKLNYKVYTTDLREKNIIRIPIWLLDVDDLALLLNVESPNQLPILEKTLKLVPVLTGNTPAVIKHKNDIIARAVLDVLLSGDESTKIRDQVTAVLTKFNTQELNLESKIVEPGYTRTLKQCLFIDKTGKMQEMELVVHFISGFIDDSLTLEASSQVNYYTLKDLEQAMEFALISEGMLKSDKVYDLANVLLVRLHTITNGDYKEYFSYPQYIDSTGFIRELIHDSGGQKCQIVNFNISYIDDRLAKVMTKIISRLLFKQAIANPNRGSIPYHIVIEEAHRYVQKDTDTNILGYNIFERITKEGRKYGVILGLITQRPSELSDTVISQCSNFIILRMSHPSDLEYIRTMIPNVSAELVEKVKNLKPGNCVAFGSAFKIPTYIYVVEPDPTPLSNNVDIRKVWQISGVGTVSQSSTTTSAIPEVNIQNGVQNNLMNSQPVVQNVNQVVSSGVPPIDRVIKVDPNHLMS